MDLSTIHCELAPPLALEQLKFLFTVIDLTSLNLTDCEETIVQLCQKAHGQLGKVAAVCVYPHLVAVTAKQLATAGIPVATVGNFPFGHEPLAVTLTAMTNAIAQGATELDIVFPYQLYLRGETAAALDYIAQCRAAFPTITLKVIIEISEFTNLEQLTTVSKILINSGVNFLKTSTGKSSHGATFAATTAMLLAIKACQKPVGIKISGGIQDLTMAWNYRNLASEIMGEQWLTATNFRIGASRLVSTILLAAASLTS